MSFISTFCSLSEGTPISIIDGKGAESIGTRIKLPEGNLVWGGSGDTMNINKGSHFYLKSKMRDLHHRGETRVEAHGRGE